MGDGINCPYCGEEFEVCTDDGQHYSDGESQSDYCPHCDKKIMISSSCWWHREAHKADCLNGISDHDWSRWDKHHPVQDFKKWFATRYCQVCDEREQAELDVTDDEEEQKKLDMYRSISTKE